MAVCADMYIFKSFFKILSQNILLVLLLVGIFLGFLAGVFLNKTVQYSTESEKLAMFIGFPGELFLRMLMLVVLPFIMSSVIMSLTMIDTTRAGKLGKRAAVYFLVTTLIATSLSVILGAFIIKPQHQHETEEDLRNSKAGSNPVFAILDMLRNMVPDNLIEASLYSTGTKLEKKVTDFRFVNKSTSVLKSAANLSLFLKKELIIPWSISPDTVQVIQEQNEIYQYAGQEKYNSVNLLGVLVLSILFGIILNGLGEKGKPIAEWCNCLFHLLMEIVQMIVWISPIGVCSIIASKLVAMENIQATIENLGLYITTVIIVSVIFGPIIVTALYAALLRRNPFRLLRCVTKALLTAFGTGASAPTIPVTLSCLKENRVMDDHLAQFLLPIGTVLNAPGTALAIAVSATFIVQTFHPNLLTLSSSILISLSSTIATLAAPPISGSVPIAVQGIVLQVIGIPSADIALLFAMDWFTDRIVTPVNVWANCTALVILEHYSSDGLQPLDDFTKSDTEERGSAGDRTNAVAINIAS